MAKEVYKKLLELQKAVVGLARDKNGNSYQYISGDKLLGVVRPLMDKCGLILVSEILDANFTRQDYQVAGGNGAPKPKTEMFCALKMRFTWVDVESGDTLPCEWASSGQNSFDKSLGSAVTFAERYFILKTLHIQTDKDDVDYPKTPEEELNDMNWEKYIASLNTPEELDAMWAQYGAGLKGNKTVIAAFNRRKKEVTSGTN